MILSMQASTPVLPNIEGQLDQGQHFAAITYDDLL